MGEVGEQRKAQRATVSARDLGRSRLCQKRGRRGGASAEDVGGKGAFNSSRSLSVGLDRETRSVTRVSIPQPALSQGTDLLRSRAHERLRIFAA